MGLKKLVNPGAFGQGADLWVIPDPKGSAWARKIDWYLNLQIARASRHVSQQMPKTIQKILEENEIHLKGLKPLKKDSPLLVAGHQHLPAQFVVKLVYKDNDEEWIEQCIDLWKRLGQPTIRVFLPTKLEGSSFEKLWPTEKQSGVSYVTDNSPIEA